jgi:hypothetical protein
MVTVSGISAVSAPRGRKVWLQRSKCNWCIMELAKLPNWFPFDFTPTGARWIHMVERLFAGVTQRCVRCGGYSGVTALEHAMLDYVGCSAKPFVWHADADLILGQVAAFLRDF